MSSMIKKMMKRNQEKETISVSELEDIKKEIYALKEKNRQYLKEKDFKSILETGKRLKCLEKRLKKCL